MLTRVAGSKHFVQNDLKFILKLERFSKSSSIFLLLHKNVDFNAIMIVALRNVDQEEN